MKRAICIALASLLLINTILIHVPAGAADHSVKGSLQCSIIDTDTILSIKTNVIDDVLFVDSEDLCKVLPYEYDGGGEGCCYNSRLGSDRLIIKGNSSQLFYFNRCLLEYDMPYETVMEDGTLWVPFTYILNVLNVNILPKDQQIMLTSSEDTLFDIIRKVSENNKQYTITLNNLYGDDSDVAWLVGSSTLTNYFTDVIETFGVNTAEVIANGFSMETKYANKLGQLFAFNSQTESESLTDAVSLSDDLFSEDGSLHDISESILKKNDTNDFSKILNKIRDGIKKNPGFRNTKDGRKLFKNMKNNIRNSKVAYRIQEFQEAMPRQIKKFNDYTTGIIFAIQMLGYMNDFSNQDDFSVKAMDYFLFVCPDDSLGKNGTVSLYATNKGLQSNKVTYSLGQTLYDNWDDLAGEMLEGIVEITNIYYLVGKVSWALAKSFIPFIKDGIGYTDSIELFVYATILEGAAFGTATKYATDNLTEVDSSFANVVTLYHCAQIYYTYLKSCYIARETGLNGLRTKAKHNFFLDEEDISPLLESQEKINKEIADMMAVLKLASPDDISDTACYGFLPCTEVVFDDTPYIKLINTSSSNDGMFKAMFEKEHSDETIRYVIDNDFDGNGTNEAFIITSDEPENEIDGTIEGKIWFIDSSGRVTAMNSGEAIPGYLSTRYSGNDTNCFSAGKQKFIVWEKFAGGSSSLSYIFGVKDNVPYEPSVSRNYENFWANTKHYSDIHNGSEGSIPVDASFEGYIGLVTTFSEGYHQWNPEYFTFEIESGEFMACTEHEEFFEYEEEPYDISECFGVNIHSAAEGFPDITMKGLDPEGIEYSNEAFAFIARDGEKVDTIVYNKNIGFTLMGLHPRMPYSEAEVIINEEYDDLLVQKGNHYEYLYGVIPKFICKFEVVDDCIDHIEVSLKED